MLFIAIFLFCCHISQILNKVLRGKSYTPTCFFVATELSLAKVWCLNEMLKSLSFKVMVFFFFCCFFVSSLWVLFVKCLLVCSQ